MPTFPQAGIVTSLDKAKALARVQIPVLGIETGWIPVSTNLLYEDSLIETQIDITEITIDPMNPIGTDEPHPGVSHTNLHGHQGSVNQAHIERATYGTLKVGNEVVVVFLNGDINDGVVIARM